MHLRGGQKSVAIALAGAVLLCASRLPAQERSHVEEQMRQLNEAINRAQAQLENSQRELRELRQQLQSIEQAYGAAAPGPADQPGSSTAAQLAAAVEEVREKQSMQDTQLGVLEQTKVESSSKYPVSLNGMILLTGFANTRQVDVAATPSVALSGGGSTGATVRQTIVGIDASGPHVFGARSHADLHLDFDGASTAADGYGSGYGSGLLHLRTAHVELDWQHSSMSFSLDRPLINLQSPDSLTAVAIPALAWSGNLWAWNPQIGVTYNIVGSSHAAGLRLQSALIDTGDPPAQFSDSASAPSLPVTTAELSRWPGAEMRVAVFNARSENGAQLGVSGYVAPHRTVGGTTFDSWAGAADLRFPIAERIELKGSVYRGQSLGGLGGGLFKDYLYRQEGAESYFQPLDDVGGWGQWKEKINAHLDLNEAFGIDSVPAYELRPFASGSTGAYYALARNRTYTVNAIYSPSAYLLFSFEYRKIQTSPVNASTLSSDIVGIAAAYKF
jgi:hypothetical protein